MICETTSFFRKFAPILRFLEALPSLFSMRILIHAANLTAGGGLAIGLDLLRAWLQKGDDLHVVASPPIARFLQTEGVSPKCWTVVSKSPGSSWQAGSYFRKIARQTESSFRPEVVFTLFGPPCWRPRAPHLCGFANGLYFLQNPVLPYGTKPHWRKTLLHRIRRWLVFRSMQKDTDVIWVETAAARQNLLSIIGPKRIEVVPNEISFFFRNNFGGINMPFKTPVRALIVAAGYPHKNFALLRALLQNPQLASGFCFHTTLPDADFKRYFPEITAIKNLGPLSPSQLADAYREADCVVCPSRAEIFSATWLEAMAAGKPLICANIPSARAICGPAALYFEDNNPGSLETVLMQLRENPAQQKELVRQGLIRLAELQPTISRAERLYQLLSNLTVPNTAAS